MAQKIDETLLRSIFPSEDYLIVSNPITKKNIISTHDGEECLNLTQFADHIYIDALSKCGNLETDSSGRRINLLGTGTDSLGKVYKLAQNIPTMKYIQLEDLSVFEKCEYKISLSTIKILTKGESWYNSLGYVSDSYETEKTENKKIIEMKYEDFDEKVYELNLEKFKQANTTQRFMDIINTLKELNALNETQKNQIDKNNPQYKVFEAKISMRQQGINEYTRNIEDYDTYIQKEVQKQNEIHQQHKRKGLELFPDLKDMTVKEHFAHIWKDINSKVCDKEKSKWLYFFFNKIYFSDILQYSVILKKKVNMETGRGKRIKTKRKTLRKLKKSRSKK